MEDFSAAPLNPAWVAIDVAKNRHEALVETSGGGRQRLMIGNTLPEFHRFAGELRPYRPCEIALEPTGDYHRRWRTF